MRVSWSSLKTWEECRQRGALTAKGKRAKASDVRNFFPGRITDRVVRDWLNNYDPDVRMEDLVLPKIESELGDIKANSEVVTWKHKTDRAEVEKACIEAVRNIEPALEKYVLPYRWMVDFAFRTPVLMMAPGGYYDRVVLNGFMDIIVFDPATETWRIYDVKHTENANYWKGSFGQLVFYAYENQMRTGQLPVEVGFFQPLVGENVKRFNVTELEVNSLAGRIQSMVDEKWQGLDMPRTDTSLCGWCDVKHACKKFQAVEVGNKGRRIVPLLPTREATP